MAAPSVRNRREPKGLACADGDCFERHQPGVIDRLVCADACLGGSKVAGVSAAIDLVAARRFAVYGFDPGVRGAPCSRPSGTRNPPTWHATVGHLHLLRDCVRAVPVLLELAGTDAAL